MKPSVAALILCVALMTGACGTDREKDEPGPEVPEQPSNPGDQQNEDNPSQSEEPETVPDLKFDYTGAIEELPVYDSLGREYKQLSKYVLTINNDAGNLVCRIELINQKGGWSADFFGDYNIEAYPVKTWSADAGWFAHMEGFVDKSGGSIFIDNEGITRYITAGTVCVQPTPLSGIQLITVSGEGVTTIDHNRESSILSFSYNKILFD